MEDGIRASIRTICEVLGFNRSNLYYAEKPHKKRSKTDETWLVDEIRKVIDEFPEYGTRRITAILRRRHSKSFNRKKIHRIVKEYFWQRWKRPYGNLVALIDCHDRYLVDWRFSRSGKAGISAGALEDALIRENIISNVHGLVIRSDNGLVFGSKRFHETVTKYRLHQEYITPYTPKQNGMIERFFRSFKEECVWQHNFVTFDEAYNKIADWIDH